MPKILPTYVGMILQFLTQHILHQRIIHILVEMILKWPAVALIRIGLTHIGGIVPPQFLADDLRDLFYPHMWG